ncbi:hypothetical protein ACX80U_11820 [Arthrobacter sp. TmT3-37]
MTRERTSAEEQRVVILEATSEIGVDAHSLWKYYASLGGGRDAGEIDAYLHGLIPLPTRDQAILTQSAWEMSLNFYPPGHASIHA